MFLEKEYAMSTADKSDTATVGQCLMCLEPEPIGGFVLEEDAQKFKDTGFCPKCWEKWGKSPKRMHDTLITNAATIRAELLRLKPVTVCLLCKEPQQPESYSSKENIAKFEETGFCPDCWAKWQASPKRTQDTLILDSKAIRAEMEALRGLEIKRSASTTAAIPPSPPANLGSEPSLPKDISYIDLELLSRSSLFSLASRDVLIWVLRRSDRVQVDANEFVFKRGESGSDFYIVLWGGLDVRTLSPEGHEVVLDVLASGDFFGETSALDNGPRTSSIKALTPLVCLKLDKGSFMELLNQCSSVAIRLLTELASRFRQVDALVEDVLFLDTEARLAKRLMALAEIYGKSSDDGTTLVAVSMSHQDFAEHLGVSRNAVKKHLKKWEKAGWIRTESDHIVLTGAAELSQIAATS
jgi:CRP/FNR family transcriptional regulator